MTDQEIPEHSENSPSSAEAWTVCEDYINANRDLEDRQSWEAAEGTAAHWISNECLTTEVDADSFIGHTQRVGRWDFTWTEDDALLLQPGIDWLRSHGGQFYGEHRVDITEYVGLDSKGRRQSGTLDAGIVSDDVIIVQDLKWGRGVPVYARDSIQIRLYAIAFWFNVGRHVSPVTDFILSIDQPRHPGGGGRTRVTLDELLAFGDWIRERAEATRQPNPPRVAGIKPCMWCRRKIARGGCETFERYVTELLGLTAEDIDKGVIQMPEFLTPDRRAVLLTHQPMIEKWLEQMRDQALIDALAGEPVGPLKAVEGRKDADRWHDEKGVARAVVEPLFGAESFTFKLKTPTQIGKKIPEDSLDRLLIDPLIKRGQRKPTLVPLEDERKAITSSAEFEDMESLTPATEDTE